ncbi:VOC family protein [Lysobacter koreensis]|uniref:VOC family protein n=1 Tax=Lysobacter koreensis TaxID=266122 RepID=A0ABW2YQR8_9GAMM
MNFPQPGVAVAFVYVSDRERALSFYCDTLGLRLRSSDAFGDFIDFGAALLRMTVMGPEYKAQPHPVLGWNVDDLASAADVLRQRGIVFTFHEGMGQDEAGIWTSPDARTKVAFFADPDGNVLTLSQG